MSFARVWLAALCLAWLAGCAAPPQPTAAADPAQDGRLVIVAVADGAEARAGAGGTPRLSYRQGPGYAGSDAAQSLADELAQAHGLAEVAAWTIAPLRWRCMLYRLPAGADRDAWLARLAADPRVQLAQPLNHFETLASGYNDPYVGLQRGFGAIGAEAAQRLSRGDGVRVAVIDTAVDATHPDLARSIEARRDFAGTPPAAAELHGTQVAGVIAATANNGIGIVGVAPGARVLAYRACWAAAAPARGARCDSFSLAQALSQAIADRADVINLSLGGPADPLLGKLVAAAFERGSVVVGALPPSGRAEGFPAGVPGVVVAAVAEAGPPPAGVVAAPGREVLTLQPGGGYDFASGSSLAAAHVSGAIALLRQLQPRLHGAALHAALGEGSGLDVCATLRRLGQDCLSR